MAPEKPLRRMATCAVLLTWLAFLAGASASAEEGVDLHYRFAIAGERESVRSGIVWLYHYSWYGLLQYKLAIIEKGRARIQLTESQLRSEVCPHPNTEAFVVVLEFPGSRWYRTADMEPTTLLLKLGPSINALGRTKMDPSGEVILILPSPVKRRITLLSEEGQPASGVVVPVSIYLYDRNHCGAHTGLPLGRFPTDGTGTLEVEAPLIPLFLDLRYFARRGEGPAGPAYAANYGLKIGPERDLILRQAWEMPDHEYELQVMRADGNSIEGALLTHWLRTDECGANWGTLGHTDSDGIVRARFSLATTERLQLATPAEEKRTLSDEELRKLFSQGRLSVRW